MRKSHEVTAMALLEEFQISFLDRFVRSQLLDESKSSAFEMTASGQDDAVTVVTVYTENTLRKLDNPFLGWAYSVLLLGNAGDFVPTTKRSVTARSGEPLRVRRAFKKSGREGARTKREGGREDEREGGREDEREGGWTGGGARARVRGVEGSRNRTRSCALGILCARYPVR